MPSENVRKRLNRVPGLTGYVFRNGVYQYYTRYALRDESVEDVVCVPPQSGKPFTSEKMVTSGGLIRGGSHGRWSDNLTPAALCGNSLSNTGHLSFPSRPTDSALVTSLLKRANPESTESNIPLFLFELRELPRLLSQAKDLITSPTPKHSISKELGGLWLQAQFGWKPFLSDLLSFINLADSIHKRAEQYKELYDKRGKSYKRRLFSGVQQSTGYNGFLHSNTIVVAGDSTSWTKKDVSGYARYVPKDQPPTTEKAIIDQARNTFSGLYLRPADLWDAFPWSWMIDYFVNVGDFIAAKQGSLHFELVEYALMETTTSHTTWTYRLDPNVYRFSPYNLWRQSKRRFKPPIAVDVNFDTPFLTAYQSSILGSLLLTR